MQPDYRTLLTDIVFGQTFPCIGAQKAFRDFRVGYFEAEGQFGSGTAARETLEALAQWASASYPAANAGGPLHFSSFVTVYPSPYPAFDDSQADQRLWEFLAAIHALDKESYPWDPGYSNFVYDLRFEMSIARYAHFVVLLGPSATTASRWFPVPALVFNPSFMFRNLDAGGLYTGWRDAIRKRERAFQRGWMNPKLHTFGEALAAPQYALSLAPIFDIGKCPFTGRPRPAGLGTYDMSGYPFLPGEVGTLFRSA